MALINITNESAGVYDLLVDQSQFTPKVSETKAGVVGVANKGPIGQPVLLTGQEQFDDIFGTPSIDGFGGLAARNLLGHTNQVYFTRIATKSAKASSGVIYSPSTSATLLGNNFSNYSFGFNRENEQLLISVNNGSVRGIEFNEGVHNTDDIVITLGSVFIGEATVTNVSGNIKIKSILTGSNSVIDIRTESSALNTLGFVAGVVKGTDATSAFLTSTNPTGVFSSTATFSSASSLDIKFDNNADLVVKLTGSFIDGIDNVVDLVREFNNFAGNNISTSLANSASVDKEKIRFTSPTTGATSVVEILSSTTADVISALGLGAIVGNPTSGTVATSAEVTNSKSEGFNLTSNNTLKFVTDSSTEKTITFNSSGNPAYSTVNYTSGAPFATGVDVLVSDWTFHMEATSGNLNSNTKEFDVAVGSSNIDSWGNLSDAINLYLSDVTSTHTSGEMTVTATATGKTGNSIIFDVSNVSSYYDTKTPTDITLGFGNGSLITDLSSAKIGDVIREINRQAGSIYATESNGKVRLSSETEGESSKVEITGANPSLGFTSGAIDFGENYRDIFYVTGATKGTWADGIIITTSRAKSSTDVTLKVFENDVLVEQFTGSTISSLPTYIDNVVNSNSDMIRVEYVGEIGEEILPDLMAELASGDSGSFVTDIEVVNGIKVFNNKELIDISLFAAPGYSSIPVLTELNRLANLRQDVFITLDPPVGYNPNQVVAWHNGEANSGNTFMLDNKYMGLYWPWVRINDIYNSQIRLVPPSVVVLELMAQNDNEQFPYTAPAGTSAGLIRRAIDIEMSPNQEERDLLYSDIEVNNINPIINLLGRGTVIWGQKTLQREFSALNRINVSRLLIYIRRRIKDIAYDIVFQPNDPVTWGIFVSEANKFLRTVVSNRGLVDFDVKMDSTTNTPQSIAENKLFGFVAVKPRLVAEKIILTFEVVGQDFNFTN